MNVKKIHSPQTFYCSEKVFHIIMNFHSFFLDQIIIRSLSEEKRSLEQSIQETEAQIKAMEEKLVEAKERERLIIEYPDLNGPVNPDLQGTDLSFF